MISFRVYGIPRPKGSKRHVGKGIMIEASKGLGEWMDAIKITAKQEMTKFKLIDAPLEICMIFYMPKKSKTKKPHFEYATKRPDIDKLVRAVLDSLTDIIYADDSKVVSIIAVKLCQSPELAGVSITIKDLTISKIDSRFAFVNLSE